MSFIHKPLLGSDSTPTSVLFESNSPYFTSNRAVFTILFSNSQILVVNSVACQTLNFSSDELCSMKLENLIHDTCKNKWSNLKKDFMQDSNYIPCSNEKLVQLVTKDNDILVVSLYLKKLNCQEKCLVVAEPIDRRGGLISTDKEGNILDIDEEVACIFQYGTSELSGTNIQCLLPALQLRTNTERFFKQYITGRTKNKEAFPVCLTVNWCNSNSGIYKILLWTYPNISGLFVLNEEFILKNCTYYFVKLVFGQSKKGVLDEPISNIIPSFCKDIRIQVGREEKFQNEQTKTEEYHDSSIETNLCTSGIVEKNHVSRADAFTNITISGSYRRNLSKERPDNNADVENTKCKLLFSKNGNEGDGNSRNSSSKTSVDMTYQFPRQDSIDLEWDNGENKRMDINKFSEYFPASGIKFLGFGKHNDGTYIELKYQVKKVMLSDELYYCVWISSDICNLTAARCESSMSRTSSICSTSLDSFMSKDNVCGESITKPGNFSLISECDEVLTTGEYNRHYTNVMEIGKGGFGYVKMAFRNSDGLLVVTKFIKKQKVNVSSWVNHSDLNIRIPLEISLLTTLQHPNIVRVLDVFHNDFFVQLVMEKHGAGFDLFEFIDRRPNCDEKLKSYIFHQIVSAVHYLDSLGILHRDIKDENIIINEKFEVKLIDFGSATFMPQDECFSKFYGTVEYCSPEVLEGNNYRGPELEIWALGVTLYILTFGENPFYDVEDTVKGRFSIPSPISSELNDLLHHMLDKNVETRITIEKLMNNCWVNQPVCIENYKFEEVVRCTENEARPPKYIYEMQTRELLSATEPKTDPSCTTSCISNSSFQSREFDLQIDFDDKLFESFKFSTIPSAVQRKDVSSGLASSTPLKKRNFRLCKSAIGIRKPTNNFSVSNDQCDNSNKNLFENNSTLSKSKILNKSSPNLFGVENNSRKESIIAWDETDPELQTRFEKCVFAEANQLRGEEFSNSPTISPERELNAGYICGEGKKSNAKSSSGSVNNYSMNLKGDNGGGYLRF